ncbi:ABC transporter ATP-binding protein [Thiolinea disciformis]|uniref:ABC transporter ATP-binding protein n=1 Tax=Thiolinea disciformis TaxID=125614 RepID=UPI000367CCEF|nr:sn-glycerol-3-phosphate ABC transporter ATP-binding protein UgpC [Thiolinea disciformis]
MASLSLRKINKRFGKVHVLHDLDLEIQDGEFVVFVGPSGCGKSTLLRLIAGLETISDGEMRIGDHIVNDLSPRERGIAMVFQSYALYPHMSVYKNMAFGLKIDGQNKQQIDQKIRDVASKLQLDSLLDRKPGQLSGGQRQRVAIGRAIVRDPKVFLFDEPLSNLDAALRLKMRIEIARLQKVLNTTTIYVTHDQVEAMTLADKIVVMNGGHIEQVGAPMELYNAPQNKFVAGFIGSPAMNFLVAGVSTDNNTNVITLANGQTLPTQQHLKHGTQLTLGIRPEHLSLYGAETDLAIEGQIESVERMGDITYIYFSMPGHDLITMAQQGDHQLPIGQIIRAYAKPEKIHLFDESGKAIKLS